MFFGCYSQACRRPRDIAQSLKLIAKETFCRSVDVPEVKGISQVNPPTVACYQRHVDIICEFLARLADTEGGVLVRSKYNEQTLTPAEIEWLNNAYDCCNKIKNCLREVTQKETVADIFEQIRQLWESLRVLQENLDHFGLCLFQKGGGLMTQEQLDDLNISDSGILDSDEGIIKYKKEWGYWKRFKSDKNGEDAFRNTISVLVPTESSTSPILGATTTSPYGILFKTTGYTPLRNCLTGRAGEISPARKSEVAYRLASHMAELHKMGYVHRGLSSESVCWEAKTMSLWISDFGLCHKDGRQYGPEFGVENYLAPEIIKGEKYSFASDVFAFGMLLYELLTGHRCFHGEERRTVLSHIARGDRPALDNSCPDSLKDLISDCVQDDPNSRPSFPDILERMAAKRIHFPKANMGHVEATYNKLTQSRFEVDSTAVAISILQDILAAAQRVFVFKRQVGHIAEILDSYLQHLTEVRSEIDGTQLGTLCQRLSGMLDIVSGFEKGTWARTALHTPVFEGISSLVNEMKQCSEEIRRPFPFLISYSSPVPEHEEFDVQQLYTIFANLQKKQVAGANEALDSVKEFVGKHHMTVIDPPDIGELGTFTEQGIFEELQHFEVKMDDFEKGDFIGRGAAGEVWRATQKSTGKQVVLKKLLNARGNHKSLRRELYALATLRHPRVVEMVGVIFEEECLSHIVMELMEKGSIVIYDGRARRVPLSPTQKTKIIFDMATGLEFLHSRQFIHRDVKPANILLDGNFRAKVGDLGSSRQVDNASLLATMTTTGTLIYLPPEGFTGHFTTKSDIYSFGMTVWEILADNQPFANVPNSFVLASRIERQMLDACGDWGEEWKELIDSCRLFDPAQRPSAKEIVEKMLEMKMMVHGADPDEIRKFYEEEEAKRATLLQEELNLFTSSSQ